MTSYMTSFNNRRDMRWNIPRFPNDISKMAVVFGRLWKTLTYVLSFCFIFKTTSAPSTTESTLSATQIQSDICATNHLACEDVPQNCSNCTFNSSCIYGEETHINCTLPDDVKCWGQRNFSKSITCSFCYQLPKEQHICTAMKTCKVQNGPHQRMIVQCVVADNTYCLGARRFRKSLPCNWSSGYRWSTAMLLSITLGGFGVDRFYLGHWEAALGKVFSFGGLGAWTLVDIILIAVGYVGPADGSLYIF